MPSTKPAIEELSGFLGVGSLEVLGVFFILDGTSGFLAFVELYAKTSAWAILVSVPLLVVAYVVGLISSLGVDALIQMLFPSRLPPELYRAVSESKNDSLMQKYLDAERHTLVLHGCTAAFLLLALGSWAEVTMMAPFGLVGYVGLVGGIVVAALCPVIACRLQTKVGVFAEAVVGSMAFSQPAQTTPHLTLNADAGQPGSASSPSPR